MNDDHKQNKVTLYIISLMLIPLVGMITASWLWHVAALESGQTSALSQWLLVIGFMTLTVGVGAAFIRSVKAESNALNKALTAISEGDLTRNTTDYSQINNARTPLRKVRDNLTNISEEAQSVTQQVQDNSKNITDNNALLAQRAELQGRNLESTSASMAEITVTVAQNADDANEGNSLSKQAMEHATKGRAIVTNAIAAMAEINEDSKKIAAIIKLIDDIAFQTNLLALNAAVEAARAGDQGRGFAVVATEVRNLAGRSAQAADEIKSLIEESGRKVENGSKLVQDSGKSLDGIVNSVQDVLHIMEKISTTSVEQAVGVSQINQSLLELDDSNQQNTSMVEEVSMASKELQAQAHSLSEVISFFKVDTVIQKSLPLRKPLSSPSQRIERRSAERPWGKTSKTRVTRPMETQPPIVRAANQ